MTFGFYTILLAQFLSALADNTLLFAAIALLREQSAPPEYVPILQQFFVISYIVLAPFVGAFSDALPKGRVMFISNLIKIVGCAVMMLGVNPLYAYALVGLGAAAYSPAKYGILTEYLPPSQLVLANSWMEGLTVMAIILGAVFGGWLLNPQLDAFLWLKNALPHTGLPSLTQPHFAILMVLLAYMSAAVVNLYIPKVQRDHTLPHKNPWFLIVDFITSFRKLWSDPLGRVSLAVTTLFWGVGSNLRLMVLVWAALQLHLNLEKSTQLTAVSAVGIAVGAIAAARWIHLENSLKVLPVGIAMGGVILCMLVVSHWPMAVALLIISGAMGGFFVVPMNALLQHRGHQLMGAGHSIAVQNFNENISILFMLGIYALIIRLDGPLRTWMRLPLADSQASFYVSVIFLSLLISGVMWWLYKRYRHLDCKDCS